MIAENATLKEQRESLTGFIKHQAENMILLSYFYNFSNKIVRKLFRRSMPVWFVGLFFSLLIYLACCLISLAAHQPMDLIQHHLILVAFVPGFTLIVAKYGYRLVIVSKLIGVFDHFIEEQAFHRIERVLHNILSLKRQLIVSSFATVLGCMCAASLVVFDSPVPIYLSSYFATAVAGFILGNGAYLGFSLVFLPRAMAEFHYDLFPLAPADSPFIEKWKKGLKLAYYIAGALFSLVLLELYQFDPFEPGINFQLALFVFCCGVFAICLLFYVPHYYFSKIISREKKSVLETLRARIDLLYRSVDPLNSTSANEIKALMEVYALVKASPDNSIGIRGWTSLFTSLILPTLSLLLGTDFLSLFR